jgi:predicted nuclease of predicted toxin-antitoxin system
VKLLFDQNISHRIIKLLDADFSACDQIRRLKLENKSDKEIWTFAGQNNFIVVTFDADFYEFSNLYGHPPKIIWLRFGNNTTSGIAQVLIEKKELINDFIKQDEFSCLELQ